MSFYNRDRRRVLLRSAAVAVLSCAMLPAPLRAADAASRQTWKKRWIASWAVLAAANALDVHSSLGHREANPLLRDGTGRFSTRRAVWIKSGVFGGFLAVQLWIARSSPAKNPYKAFTIVNSAAVGGLGAAAARNYSLPGPAPRPLPSHLAPRP